MGQSEVTLIYHIVAEQDWDGDVPHYTGDAFAQEGFIHCSTADQVLAVANRLFRGRTDLLVLAIDTARLAVPIVYENLEGGSELYPHVYGPLARDAVVTIYGLAPGTDGSFITLRA